MSAPRYRKGTIPRDLMDILKDAPGRKMKRAALIRVVAKRRDTTVGGVRNAVAVALHRMISNGDCDKPSAGVYRLVCDPVPDHCDNATEWQESSP